MNYSNVSKIFEQQNETKKFKKQPKYGIYLDKFIVYDQIVYIFIIPPHVRIIEEIK